MHYIACTAIMLTCQLLLVCTVLVTKPNKNMGDSSFPSYGLGEELIDKMIAENRLVGQVVAFLKLLGNVGTTCKCFAKK